MSNVAAGKDTDDDGESLNDVETVLNKMNIKLRDSKKEWRSFEDVLDEIGEKWNDFAETEQSQIATAIAGKQSCQVPEYIEMYSAMQYKNVA
jgi:TP901 family phage tail tape measure protein